MTGVSTREGWIGDTDAPALGGGTVRTLAHDALTTRTDREGLGRPRGSETLVAGQSPGRLAARRRGPAGA